MEFSQVCQTKKLLLWRSFNEEKQIKEVVPLDWKISVAHETHALVPRCASAIC